MGYYDVYVGDDRPHDHGCWAIVEVEADTGTDALEQVTDLNWRAVYSRTAEDWCITPTRSDGTDAAWAHPACMRAEDDYTQEEVDDLLGRLTFDVYDADGNHCAASHGPTHDQLHRSSGGN